MIAKRNTKEGCYTKYITWGKGTSMQKCGVLVLIILAFICSDIASASINVWPRSVNSGVRSNELPANVTLSLDKVFFDNTIALMLPTVNEILRNITFPPQHENNFEIAEIHFSSFNLPKASMFMESPNQLFLVGTNISASIPRTKFVATVGLIKCDGSVEAVLSSTNVTLMGNITRASNGTLRLQTATNSIQWGQLNIKHSLEGFACKAVEKLVEVILGELDKVIASLIESELPKRVGPIVEEKTNSVLETIPIIFTNEPNITSERMILYMDVVPNTEERFAALHTQKLPRLGFVETPLPKRNFAAVMPLRAINNFIKYYTMQGTLNRTIQPSTEYNSSLIRVMYPRIYAKCPNCPFAFTLGTSFPPLMNFSEANAVTLRVCNVLLEIQLVPQTSDDEAVTIVGILLNITEGVTNVSFTSGNEFYFHLKSLDVFSMELVKSNIGPMDMNELSNIVRSLFNFVLIPLFNAEFHGLRIPEYFDQPLLDMSHEILAAGINVHYLR